MYKQQHDFDGALIPNDENNNKKHFEMICIDYCRENLPRSTTTEMCRSYRKWTVSSTMIGQKCKHTLPYFGRGLTVELQTGLL